MPEAPLWFAGVCDSVLRKVESWVQQWPYGEVVATRDFLDVQLQTQKLVTKRALRVQWKRAELEHLVRILLALKPKWAITADMQLALRRFNQAKLVPGNERELLMITYREDPLEILEVLLEAKRGPVVEKKPQSGKRLWG